jgi:hypothetical protein
MAEKEKEASNWHLWGVQQCIKKRKTGAKGSTKFRKYIYTILHPVRFGCSIRVYL